MRVDIPDYEVFVEFDDDTSPDEVQAVMARHFPSIVPKTLDEYIGVNSHPRGRELLLKALRSTK